MYTQRYSRTFARTCSGAHVRSDDTPLADPAPGSPESRARSWRRDAHNPHGRAEDTRSPRRMQKAGGGSAAPGLRHVTRGPQAQYGQYSEPSWAGACWVCGWKAPDFICSITLHGGVDRHGEADALVAAALRGDLLVDADHVATRVDQRTAGVAGVDRGVGLDAAGDDRAVRRLQLAVGRRDDARREREVEAQRVADGDDLFADRDLRRVAERDRQGAPGAVLGSTRISATSVDSSTPTMVPGTCASSAPSPLKITVTKPAARPLSLTTWALVRMSPSSETTKPVPSARWSPEY